MMQTLDVISVNLWQIVISLLNLVILFLLIKHFLFKPVKRVLTQRQMELDERYDAAEAAEKQAEASREKWEETLSHANEEADSILQTASENARLRADKLVTDAQAKADGILRVAQSEAELERKKAADGIKREIVEVSGVLTEKLLEREMKPEDHRALIDAFLTEMEEGHG